VGKKSMLIPRILTEQLAIAILVRHFTEQAAHDAEASFFYSKMAG
jgi:hypothetical protein